MTDAPTAPPVSFTCAGILRGARAGIPPMLGAIPFGIVTGMLCQRVGMSLTEAVLMAALVYAGSAQLVILASWAMAPSLLAVAVATFAVNVRMGLMGPVLAPMLDRVRGAPLIGTLLVTTDQSFAMSVKAMAQGERDPGFLFGVGFLGWVSWIGTGIIGHVLADMVRLPGGHPVFYAALAVPVSILVNLWRGRGDVLPWGMAAGVALAVAQVLPHTSWHIVAGALAGSVTGALRMRRP